MSTIPTMFPLHTIVSPIVKWCCYRQLTSCWTSCNKPSMFFESQASTIMKVVGVWCEYKVMAKIFIPFSTKDVQVRRRLCVIINTSHTLSLALSLNFMQFAIVLLTLLNILPITLQSNHLLVIWRRRWLNHVHKI
jgi:hypothetical protein